MLEFVNGDEILLLFLSVVQMTLPTQQKPLQLKVYMSSRFRIASLILKHHSNQTL